VAALYGLKKSSGDHLCLKRNVRTPSTFPNQGSHVAGLIYGRSCISRIQTFDGEMFSTLLAN
jgi:hypothetical protein